MPQNLKGFGVIFTQMNMQLTSLHIASLIGLTGMLMAPAPEFWPTIGTCVVVSGGLILQILKNREAKNQREADKQERLDHQEELRLEIERVRVTSAASAAKISRELQVNTDLTLEGIQKTVEFADAANHVQSKLDIIAKNATTQPMQVDTNQTVHRIEKSL